MKVYVAMLAFALNVLACAAPIRSRQDEPPYGADGVSYALPRNLVRLTAVRSGPFDTAKAKEQIALLTTRNAEQEKKLLGLDDAVAALLKTRTLLQAATGTQAKAAVTSIDGRVEEFAKAMVDLRKKIADQQAEIERLTNQKASGETCFDTLSLALLPAEPDPKLRFVARLEHSIFRDDKWAITTTPTGLLSSTDATISDRTADVVVELAKSAAQVARAGTSLGMTALLPPGAPPAVPKPQCIPFRRDLVFDPAESGDPASSPCPASSSWRCVNQTLSQWGIKDADLSVDPEIAPVWTAPAQDGGFHYRRPIPYTIVLRSQNDVQTTRFLIPNGAPIDTISIPALTFVSAKYGIKFDQGMLTSVDAEEPSEAMAVAAFPGRVAKELISIPTDLIQLKIDHSTKEAGKIEAEKAILDAKKALLESDKALREAQKAQDSQTLTPPPE